MAFKGTAVSCTSALASVFSPEGWRFVLPCKCTVLEQKYFAKLKIKEFKTNHPFGMEQNLCEP